MKIVSVINYKGGVGKTTTTSNLAAELAWRGKKILMLDLDPQASLTFSFITPDEWREKYKDKRTIKSWYDAAEHGDKSDLSRLIITPARVKNALRGNGKLDLICSHLGLLNVDLELATELGGSTMKKQRQNHLKVYTRLSTGLKGLPPETYDYVLIDCPPNFNIVTRNAITASQHILVPAKPDYLSTLGIDYLKANLVEFVHDYNEFAGKEEGVEIEAIDPEILGVYFTMVQYNGREPISAIRPFIRQTEALDVPVFKTKMRENKTQFSTAPQEGVPVVLLRASGATYENIRLELEELAQEFLERLEDE